ncbi:MAG: family 3 adenylate cyclase [Ignavibacteria bacterium]|nr:family 3 adenylate cyclase [Ignavibacteria bacterium]
MKNSNLILIVIIIVFSLNQQIFSQRQGQAKIDSLLSVLPKAKEDTNKVNLLIQLSNNKSDAKPDEAIKYAQTAIDLASKLNFERGLAYSLKSFGLAYYVHGKYIEALNYFH